MILNNQTLDDADDFDMDYFQKLIESKKSHFEIIGQSGYYD